MTASRFGTVLGGDFSAVRVHDGPAAAAASSSLGARAFSLGDHIGFDTGEYRPGTIEGDALLAHELAHVQQHAGTVLTSRTGTASRNATAGPVGGDDEAAFEADADRAATGALARLWGAPGRVAHGVLDASSRLQATRPRLRRCDRRPPATPSDYRIERLPRDAATQTDNVYFERNQSTIPPTETGKIAAIANPAPPLSAANPLGLFGYASEDETNPQVLAQARIDGVKAQVKAQSPPGASDPTSVNRHADTAGRPDYRQVRMVEAVRSATPQPAVSAEPTCPAGPATAVPCTPQQVAGVNAGVADGSQWIQHARDKVDGDDAAALQLVAVLFNGGVSPVPAGVKASVVLTLDRWKTHLGTLNQLGPAGQPVKFECRVCGECQGKNAWNNGVGKTPEITLCPDWLAQGAQGATATLIHEAGHGLPPMAGPPPREFKTTDYAYRHSRRIVALTTAEALRNTDSYLLLIRKLQGHAVNIGPNVPDDLAALSDSGPNPERVQAQRTIAWAENHLRQAEQLTTDTYGYLRRSRAQGKWLDEWGRAGMQKVSDRLPGLSTPGSAGSSPGPTLADQHALAAIADRYRTMLEVFTKGRVRAVKGGSDWWTVVSGWPGDTVTLSPGFFSLTPRRQLDRMLEVLIVATIGISPGLREGYRLLIEDMRLQRGVGSP